MFIRDHYGRFGARRDRNTATSLYGGQARVNKPAARAGCGDVLPTPPSEYGQWLLAFVFCALGTGVLVVALLGALDGGRAAGPVSAHPLAVPAANKTQVSPPAASAIVLVAAQRGGISSKKEVGGQTVPRRPRGKHGRSAVSTAQAANAKTARSVIDQGGPEIPRQWMEGFYPIYGVAQSTFGVNWLLIASIHKQESAFSTDPTTYGGLNSVGCCGGPMQFNVTNGPVTTWDRVSDSYRYANRPPTYDHMTTEHPSIYDDFDAIMAAAHLMSDDGATYALNAAAWTAAYDYYGHDAFGINYADQVLARAIGWSQHGFCTGCGVESVLVDAVHAAYAAPALATAATDKPATLRTRQGRPRASEKPGLN